MDRKIFLPDAEQMSQLLGVAWNDFCDKAQAAGFGIGSDEVRCIVIEFFVSGYTYGWNDALNIIRGQMDADRLADGIMSGSSNYDLNIDVCHLPFSVRLINVLRNADINTLGDLLRVNKISLFELNGLGKKCLDEIKDFYAANGYDFGTEFLEWERGRGHYLPKKQHN